MGDADLEEIRRARLQQLQQQGGGGGGGDDQHQRRQQQAEAEANARANILGQILTPEAADRLNRIRLVKEARAADVENRLIMLARSGQLRARVGEDQLKEILAAMSEQSASGGLGRGDGGSGEGAGASYRYARRKGWDDDDDDLLDGLE